MDYTYKTHGTCSRIIHIKTNGDEIENVKFEGGCAGNAQGLSKLIVGWKIDDVIDKLKGIDCAGRGTSCPDQLAHALIEMKEKAKEEN